MRVLALEAENFRNLSHLTLNAHPSKNLILGNNAQGKTNLLEAIWLCTGCRSFRGARERDFIQLKAPAMHLKLRFADSRREQEIQFHMQRGEGRQKKILLSGVPQKGGSGLFAAFQCVVFSPDDRELIRGGPEKRRSFMDLCGSQLTPGMLGALRRFDQLTLQRNAVLKAIAARKADVKDLAVWDTQLARIGCMLTCLRAAYFRQLAPVCAELYGKITGGTESFSVQFRSNLFRASEIPAQPTQEMQAHYFRQLQAAVQDDIRLGFTGKGAGRDDFSCRIGGLSAKEFGSQGQQKSAALVLKLAQASVFYAKREETPVILLDDVMGELDAGRQKLVYELMRDMQVFVTTPSADALQQENGAVFRMESGQISAVSEGRPEGQAV